MPRKSKTKGGVNGHMTSATNGHPQAAVAPPTDVATTIAQIRAWHRQRVFAMDQRKRSDLALGAFLRTQLGWSRALPKAEAEKIRKQATDLIAIGEKVAKGKANSIHLGQWGPIIMASIQGRAHWDAIESAATKEMERLASSLPIWPAFGEGIKGFGARSLAVILGEAGDLSLYANPGKLWKRMGLAVMNGVRQGGLRKTASAEDWIAHGYSARRRSFMFVIGDVLIKNQNPYRDVYLERKEFERAKAKAAGLTVAPAAKIPEKRKAEFMSDGHVHRRAQRYMEKRLLKNLWQAWRRASLPLSPRRDVPAAESNRQTSCELATTPQMSAQRSAIVEVNPPLSMPSAPIPAKAGKRRAIDRSEPMGPVPAATSSADEAERSANVRVAPITRLPSASIPAKAGKAPTTPRLRTKGFVSGPGIPGGAS